MTPELSKRDYYSMNATIEEQKVGKEPEGSLYLNLISFFNSFTVDYLKYIIFVRII